MSVDWIFYIVHSKKYLQTSNISRTLVGNKIDYSDVAGASPDGAASTTSSLSTWHLASMDWANSTVLIHKSHNAPVPYPTMHHFGTEMCTHFCYRIVHCGTPAWCIVGFVRWVYCKTRRETFEFGVLVCRILEVWRYTYGSHFVVFYRGLVPFVFPLSFQISVLAPGQRLSWYHWSNLEQNGWMHDVNAHELII